MLKRTITSQKGNRPPCLVFSEFIRRKYWKCIGKKTRIRNRITVLRIVRQDVLYVIRLGQDQRVFRGGEKIFMYRPPS